MPSTALKDLADNCVSIWLEDLSPERISSAASRGSSTRRPRHD
jgi:hypothetical protein